MKKIFVLVFIGSFYVTHIFSQTDEVIITWPMVVAEAKKTDEHITNPKKSEKSRTWTERMSDAVGRYPAACLAAGILLGVTIGCVLKRR